MHTDVLWMEGVGINRLVKCTNRFRRPFMQKYSLPGLFLNAKQIRPVRGNSPLSAGRMEVDYPILCGEMIRNNRVPCMDGAE
jgi:hypothetical protein